MGKVIGTGFAPGSPLASTSNQKIKRRSVCEMNKVLVVFALDNRKSRPKEPFGEALNVPVDNQPELIPVTLVVHHEATLQPRMAGQPKDINRKRDRGDTQLTGFETVEGAAIPLEALADILKEHL